MRPGQPFISSGRSPPGAGTGTGHGGSCAESPGSPEAAPAAEPALFAAPSVRQRDGRWALVGFRTTEPEGVLAFEILAPAPVPLQDGALVAVGDESP